MNLFSENKILIIKLLSSVVGLVFLFSALTKLIDIRYFTHVISEYEINIFVYSIPFLLILEIFLGIELLLNLNIKRNSIIVAGFLAVLTIIYAYGYLVKGIEDCACFGNTIQMSAVFVFVRNVILIIFSLILIKHSRKEKGNTILKTIALIGLGFGVFFTGNYFTLPAGISHNYTKIHKLQDKNILETEFGKSYNFNKDSTYIVFAFSYTCPHCLNSIENAKQYNQIKGIDKTLFYINGDGESRSDFYQYFKFDVSTLIIENKFTSNTISSLPTTLIIRDNKITQVFVGELPSNLIFEKKILN